MPNATPKIKNVVVSSDKLHRLLNEVAKKAYLVGYSDGRNGTGKVPNKVFVSEASVWKVK